MLVLSRTKDESVILQQEGRPDIRVTVCRVRHERIYLGFDAPDDVTIMREELLDQEGSGE